MKKLLSFIFGTLFLMPLPLYGMELAKPGNKQKTSRYSIISPSKALGKMIKAIDDVKPGGTININNFFTNNPELTKPLIKACLHGVNVSINTRNIKKNTNVLKTLVYNGVKVYLTKNMHEKNMVIQNADGSGMVFAGSLNLSNLAGQHKDLIVQSTSPTKIEQYINNHKFDSKKLGKRFSLTGSPQKTPEKPQKITNLKKLCTPQKSTLYNSQLFDTNVFQLSRIQKPIEEGTKHIYNIRTMTVDGLFIDELINKAQQKNATISIAVDGSMLNTDSGIKNLEKLSKAGVKVSIFNPHHDTIRKTYIPRLGHGKYLLRKIVATEDEKSLDKNQTLTLIPSSNFTQRGGQEINTVDTYVDNPEMSALIENDYEKFIKECVSYNDLDLDKITEKREQKREKDKAKRQQKRKRDQSNNNSAQSKKPAKRKLFKKDK